jgi:dolichyl-phosphate beta-glucosyltransferase
LTGLVNKLFQRNLFIFLVNNSNMLNMDSLTIVIPAYNEETRLPRTFGLLKHAIHEGVFKKVHLREILVLNDGSKDLTQEVCEKFYPILDGLRCISINPNQGKGNAIHTGMKAAQGDWILIADADTATPWDQFEKLWERAHAEQSQIAMGSRDLPESQVRTKQSWVRENMGKIFNLIVRLITKLPYKDTQCGFKLIEKKRVSNFLNQLQTKRFAWDVEFLMFARKNKLKISEVPVTWEHQEASRVHPIRDASEMLIRVIEMRIRI